VPTPCCGSAGSPRLPCGLTSYDGGVCYGLDGDRDAMYDIATLRGMITGSLAELGTAVR